MRTTAIALFACLTAGLAFAGCTTPDSGSGTLCQLKDGTTGDGNGQVVLRTNFGNMTVELFLDQAPITAGNFLNLSDDGFYDNTTFHRAIKDFMVQGGDPTGTGRGGPGYTIKDEFAPGLTHDQKGRLSMANSGPNTGGSQFFIIFAPTPHLDGRHAVFGQVTGGMDVLDRINAEAARPSSDGKNGVPPLKPITLISADASCL
ncbi:MAG: peptidylprolyl isomerase [Candidatus Thermoplasmatota archaeon]|jgi:peptidyl-prolyl cis-trans isomerase A (cyclophilin A)